MESFGEYTVRGITYKYRRFVNITNDFEAYTIGYLACDGGFILNHGFPIISVSGTEQYIINAFQDYWVPGRAIYNVGINSSTKVNAINPVFELRFPSRLSKTFSKYGIFCKKINRRMVGISHKYFLPYFAGVIDADGFISVTHRKDCRTPRLRFFITHQSERYLADLQEQMIMRGVASGLRQHGDKNCYRLSFQHTALNINFLSTIYPYLRNNKKRNVLNKYLNNIVPQKSDELLEGVS